MQRRRFLKLMSLAILAPAVRLPFPLAATAANVDCVSYGGLLYRAGGKGKILTSADRGATWTLHSDLGDIYSVSRLSVDRNDRLRGTVDYGTFSFTLSLGPDKRSWWLTT
jgi:hypothetical protein